MQRPVDEIPQTTFQLSPLACSLAELQLQQDGPRPVHRLSLSSGKQVAVGRPAGLPGNVATATGLSTSVAMAHLAPSCLKCDVAAVQGIATVAIGSLCGIACPVRLRLPGGHADNAPSASCSRVVRPCRQWLPSGAMRAIRRMVGVSTHVIEFCICWGGTLGPQLTVAVERSR